MDLGLKNQVALITGGSEGIGKAAAVSLGHEGARLAICARRSDVLNQAVKDVSEQTGAQVLAIPGDVTKPQDIARIIDATLERYGQLNVLINNAGTSRAGSFESVTDQIWQEDLELKLFGAIRMIRQALPHLRKAGGGSILQLLNIAAKHPHAGSEPSAISRAAGMALMKALSKELAGDNIRVNAVLIGLVKSAQHERKWREGGQGSSLEAFYQAMAKDRGVPLGRVGETQEAGDLLAFLCSPRAAYLNGAAINLDGGASAVV